MAETLQPQRPQTHEQRDVQTRAVALFGGALVMLLAGSLTLVGWLLADMRAQMQQRETIPTALLESRPQPPEPHLQQAPWQELQERQAAEAAVLQRYGWVDQTAGIGRIPITRAMEFLAEHGLPTWGSMASEPSRHEKAHP